MKQKEKKEVSYVRKYKWALNWLAKKVIHVGFSASDKKKKKKKNRRNIILVEIFFFYHHL